MVQQDKMTKEQRDPMGFYNIQPTQPPSQLLQPPPTFTPVVSQNQPPLVQSTYAGQTAQSNSQGIQQPVQYNPNTPLPSIPMNPPNSLDVTSQKIPTSFPPYCHRLRQYNFLYNPNPFHRFTPPLKHHRMLMLLVKQCHLPQLMYNPHLRAIYPCHSRIWLTQIIISLS